MPNSATRLITLILLLQRRPNQKAGELAEALGVSVRSIHRYMERLDEMGIPIYTERGPNGGFSLVRGYRMPPLIFSPEEAVVVSLGAGIAADLFGDLYREAARSALAKLENVLPEDQRSEVAWALRALVAAGLHRADLQALAPRLDGLRSAVREYCRVSMLYRSGGRVEALWRNLDPYALVFRWGWWYVIGWCHLRQGVRSFRVDRILELRRLETSFEPPDFDVRAYLANEFQAQPLMNMRMRFPAENAHLARDSHTAWESLEECPDGSVEVRLSVPDPIWGASTALAYGPAATVLGPPEIRSLVRQWAKQVAEQYEHDKHDNEDGAEI